MWLSLEEAAVLLGLLELLTDEDAPELRVLRERWQTRLGSRMSEAMTGLAPDGFDAIGSDADESAADA